MPHYIYAEIGRIHLETSRHTLPQSQVLKLNANLLGFKWILNIDLNVLLKVIPINVENKGMDIVKSVAHDYQRELIGQLCLLQNTTNASSDTFYRDLYILGPTNDCSDSYVKSQTI